MAEIKGKFIILTASLMGLYKDARLKADQILYNDTGLHWDERDPEDWYHTKHYKNFMDKYVEASLARENALITLGRNIYPKIQQTVGSPPELKFPLDYILFESRGYIENIRGPEIKPRKFIKEEEGYVILQTKMIEQDCTVFEGVYLGILEMIGIMNGKVEHKKYIKRNDDTCEFHIIW